MTPERFRRLQAALARRQPDLTVLLEGVHKPHNLSAVLRTCDAVGIFEVHAVAPERRVRPSHAPAGGTEKWVGVRQHPDLAAAAAHLRGRGLRLLAAHPSADAVDFRQIDYTPPTAVLLGQEKDGLTSEALAATDGRIFIPMLGLVPSLNVSVAAALILFEAQRQRSAAGLYEESRLDPELFRQTLFEWAYPVLAERCRREGRPYPRLGEEGELLEPVSG